MKIQIIAYLLIIILLSACKNKFDVDTSNIKLDLKIERFDTAFYKLNDLDTDKMYYKISQLRNKNKDFFDLYCTQVIGIGLPENISFLSNLSDFFLYGDEQNLFNSVWEKFPIEQDFLTKELTNAFEHYLYYFGNDTIPRIYTCVSGFNVSVFTSDKIIGISLDKYLGSDFRPYNQMFEKYLVRRMDKRYIAVDVMKAYAMQTFPFNDSVRNVICKMIYEGRIQYFVDAMLPQTNDTIKWGYSKMQWQWANKYESKIWDYLVDQKALFSNKNIDIKTLTEESPFTAPFGQYSAPRAGNFIGYKIVQSFMNNNKNVSIAELMSIRDYMYIYNNSHYRP